jgi:membrane-associated protease RseP (regulator of RpoE activity)
VRVSTVLSYILGIVVVAVGVLLSILLHEAGHFVFAKLFKVRVGQFMVGFGKTLWSKKIGETEFGVKALPLGGYISMAGMYPPVKPGGRARTASTGFFQTLVQDAGPGIVDTIDPEPEDQDDRSGFFKTLVADARSASADTILPGHEDRVFYKLAIWKRIVIMLGGPVMNLLIATVLIAIILTSFGIQQIVPTVDSVQKCVLPASSTSTTCPANYTPTPAAKAGFQSGDKILSLNGVTVTSWTQTTDIIEKLANKKLTAVVLRDGHKVTLVATPLLSARYESNPVTGALIKDSNGKPIVHKVGFLGIAPSAAVVKQPLSAVGPTVWTDTTNVAGVVLNLPQRLVGVWNAAFGSAARDPNGPIGLVGVGRIAGQVAAAPGVSFTEKFGTLLSLLASLNIALFVFNLVPLMPLDGGHIIGALWEGLKRGTAKLFRRADPGPVDTAKVVPLTFAVVIVLGAVSLLLLYADIVKPITLPN